MEVAAQIFQAFTLQIPVLGSCELQRYTQECLPDISELEANASAQGWSAEHIESSINAGHLCVALFCKKTVLAHAVFSVVLDECELLILSVAKHYQGRGLASVFLSALFESWRGKISRVYLEVRESNLAAQALYKKLHFVQTGLRKHYYLKKGAEREAALLFALNLQDL